MAVRSVKLTLYAPPNDLIFNRTLQNTIRQQLTDARPKTRGKAKASINILEETYTSLSSSCHGKLDMFFPITRICRESVFLTLFVFGVFFNYVDACDVDSCSKWNGYYIASQDLNRSSNNNRDNNNSKGESKNAETGVDLMCTGLRTYIQCLEELHGCKGNIHYHSLKKVLGTEMNVFKCTIMGPVYTKELVTPHLLPDELCTFRGKNIYRHCGLFGDPHLRTFGNKLQTCRVRGAWALIDNEHITVQVTNALVSHTLQATATDKLTVLIKKNADCASDKYIMYQADSSLLPSTFDDGQAMYGKSHSVSLVEVDPGKHVEIYIKYIDTKILIRLIGSYLTFSITVPEEILNSTNNEKGLELCVRGCPVSEEINYQKVLALKDKGISKSEVNMSRKDAEVLCREANLVDFYFDSCVFDLMTTGNKTFLLSADMAMHDFKKTDPDFQKQQSYRTDLEMYDKIYRNGVQSILTECHFKLLTIFIILVIFISNIVIET